MLYAERMRVETEAVGAGKGAPPSRRRRASPSPAGPDARRVPAGEPAEHRGSADEHQAVEQAVDQLLHAL
jgi:hypothetical protein